MRRALLLIVGLGTGGLLLLALYVNAAAQYTYPRETAAQLLPADIEGTSLRAVQLAVYEGPFWEDGTGEETVDIAALVLENTGVCFVIDGAVVLDWGEDRLVFELSWLPPGEKVLVLEKDRKSYREIKDGICYGWTSEDYPETTEAVTVEPAGETSLAFTNRTDSVVPGVSALYKHYDEESDMYIGGITYSMPVELLQPGEIRIVTPWRYAAGYSRVVCVMASEEE